MREVLKFHYYLGLNIIIRIFDMNKRTIINRTKINNNLYDMFISDIVYKLTNQIVLTIRP